MPKMHEKNRVSAGLSATLAVLTMGVQSATAQSTDAALGLEEVIITAERRETDLQKTAASVTVRTGEQLEEQGKYSLRDILQDIPGVTGGAANGFGGTGSDSAASGITIRGISSSSGGGGETVSTSSTAAIYVDGVYGGIGGNYDIERVEVLSGPQGTLYGRSATSGVVATHTRNPDLGKFGGDVTAEFGNYNLSHYTAALNAPLVSDKLAVRVSGNRYERDGLRGYYNAATGQPEGGRGGWSKTTEGRIKLLYRPTEDLSLSLGVALQNNDNQSGGVSGRASTNRDVVLWQSSPLGSAENDYRQYWAQIDWNLGLGTLTYQPAYRSWTQLGHSITSTGTTRGDIDTFVDTPDDTFWTHEIRLASNPDSKVAWQTGVMSYDNHVKNFNDWHFTPSGSFLSSRDSDKSTKALGAYAETTYPIANTWRVTAGLRYDHTKVAMGQHFISAMTGPTSEDTISKDEGTRTFDNWTYKLRAEHDLGPENLVYGSISTGFSPGDVSLASCGATICVIELDAETLTAYEIGSKNRFLDNRLQLNGAIYYNDYGAYQTGSFNVSGDPANPSFATIAVPVKAWGLELNLLYQITSADRVGLSGGYSIARYIDKPAIFAAANASDNIAGSPYTANLSYEHVFHLPGGWTWNVHGDVQYQAARDGNLSAIQKQNGGEPYVHVGYNAVGNLSTGVVSSGGLFSVNGWVRNFTDNQSITSVSLGTNTQPFTFSQQLNEPRTYGVSASLKF